MAATHKPGQQMPGTDLPPRPDHEYSPTQIETLRKLFFTGAQQASDLPHYDVLLQLALEGHKPMLVYATKGWYFLSMDGVDACLKRGWGREKERNNLADTTRAVETITVR